MIRPIALYALEVWAISKTDEKNLAGFDREVLRPIFGQKKNKKRENTSEERTMR